MENGTALPALTLPSVLTMRLLMHRKLWRNIARFAP
jgi:hypothetical protein